MYVNFKTMKTAILILTLLIIGLSSCETVKKHHLPIEVVKLKESNQMDTLLVVKTNDKTYLFDKKEEYLGAYDNEENPSLYFLTLIIGIVVGFAVAAIAIRD